MNKNKSSDALRTSTAQRAVHRRLESHKNVDNSNSLHIVNILSDDENQNNNDKITRAHNTTEKNDKPDIISAKTN